MAGTYFDSYDPSAYLASKQSGGGTAVAQQPAAAPKTNWLSLLPSAAATAASFIPGVGSVVAGGLGAAGELAREKLAGENVDLAKIGTEGALSAIPLGLGRIGKVAKLGIDAAKGINVTAKGLQVADKVAQGAGLADKAVQGAADVAKVGETVAPVASAAPIAEQAAAGGPNLLQKIGNNLTESARGIAPGAKAAGQDRLGVNSADELNTFLSQVPGVQGKNARDTLGILEKYHQGWGKQIGDIVDKNNSPLLPTDLSAVKQGIDTHLADITGLPKSAGTTALIGADGKALVTAGVGKPEHAYIDNLYGDLGGVKDVKGLNDLRVKLDQDAINYGRSSNNPDPVKEQIAKAFRSGLSDFVGERVPELGAVQNLYSQSAHAQDFLKTAAAAPKGGVNLLGFFGGPKVGGGVVQGLTAKAGQAASAVGDAGAAPAGGLLGKIGSGVKTAVKGAGAFGAQELTRGLADATNLTSTAEGQTPTFDASKVIAPGADANAGADLAAAAGQTTPGAADASGSDAGGVTDAELLAMQRQALSNPDAKSQAAQLSLITQLIDQRDKLGPKSGKPLSSTASQQLGNAQSGLSAINQLRSELGKNPNEATANAIAGVGGNIGRGVAGTQSYEAARGEVTDILARLRTGAAISKTEEAQYKALLPTAFDSPQVISQKLDRYEQLFQGIADRAQAGSPALEAAGVAQN